jgi:hypothetical protein
MDELNEVVVIRILLSNKLGECGVRYFLGQCQRIAFGGGLFIMPTPCVLLFKESELCF